MSNIKFDENSFYHIFNRAISKDKLFISDKDYYYFKKKLIKFILPIADIYAYCLMPTHFHLLIKTKYYDDLSTRPDRGGLSNGRDLYCFDIALNNLFNSYARSFNKAHDRHGKLFQQSFKHKAVIDDDQLLWTIYYIHRNPVHHNYVDSCKDWKNSSYQDLLYNSSELLDIESIINLYDGYESIISFTENMTEQYKIEKLISEFDIE